jgi:hypothetical protein
VPLAWPKECITALSKNRFSQQGLLSMLIKLTYHNHDFTVGTDATTFECLVGSALLKSLGNTDHIENSDFLEFFVCDLLPDEELSHDAMYEALPILAQYELSTPVISASLINWADHAQPYLVAFSWFAKLYITDGAETATRLFEKMTVIQKTIIQRGYEIMFTDAFPPLPADWQYTVGLQVLDDHEATVFPIGRVATTNNEMVLDQICYVGQLSSRAIH